MGRGILSCNCVAWLARTTLSMLYMRVSENYGAVLLAVVLDVIRILY